LRPSAVGPARAPPRGRRPAPAPGRPRPPPPEVTFGWLPMLTITDDLVLDGNVAVPAIYPVPLLIVPNARTITDAGRAAIVELAGQLGLLDGQTDFTGGERPPGGQSGHLLIVIGGVTHELVGDPHAFDGSVSPESGSPQAFGAFWQQIGYLDEWLAAELGPSGAYTPERLALVTVEAREDEHVQPGVEQWPLAVTFAELGVPFPLSADALCATISGDDLETLLPVLDAANQLTWFIDAEDEARSLLVRPLVPGEASPGPAAAA
jgi:hypothetical protein